MKINWYLIVPLVSFRIAIHHPLSQKYIYKIISDLAKFCINCM